MALVLGQAVSVGADSAGSLRGLHEGRAAAELAAADRLAPGSDAVASRGELLADVVVVKGLSGPAEASGAPAVSGADGDAVHKALEALGHDPDRVFFTLSRPEPGLEAAQRSARLRLQIEAVDPRVVIALDAEAAADLAAAFDIAPIALGAAVPVLGRRFVAVGGLEASLADDRSKRTVWRELKAATPDAPSQKS